LKEIKLFGRALDLQDVEFRAVNTEAIAKGYAVAKECCNMRVIKYLKTLPENLNTTFYKSWNDVTSKSRYELLLDQLVHYCTTYGTNHQGTPYIPNDNPEVIDFTDCKVIMPITPAEIADKITAMFASGIALKQETIEDCFELIDELDLKIDVNAIANREVLMIFCDRMGVYPSNPVEMVRFLIYKATGNTLLIKDRKTISMIEANRDANIHSIVNEYGVDKLSEVFFRFKPIFLAFKRANNANSRVINQLRRKAKANHKAMIGSFWNDILSNPANLPKLDGHLSSLTNFKKIALMQTIKVREVGTGILPVLVRNGKLFVKERDMPMKEYHSLIYNALMNSLLESLSAKKCKIKLHDSLQLALPTSEKSFIGNIPFGSYIHTDVDTIAGIHWRGEDGTQDFDLSGMDIEGNKIGWNSNYYNGDKTVVYSGDMTSANPNATELIYCAKGAPDMVIKTNRYCGAEGSKYSFFIAKTHMIRVTKNHMVNPNDVVFMTQLESTSRENMNGMFVDSRFYFADLVTGSGAVSVPREHEKLYMKHVKETVRCSLDLREILLSAGFEIVDNASDADIDLSVMDKSTLIELLS
jgi:hypothetical protein